ncbi:MAG: xanthine dehydrogenase family protein molybdopterin-binding subunit [Inquilinus sp.]|nr:xanthine dehydrogenase family protein molybdopterin-binding subunit [Inquilinus sp.]
MSMRAGRLTRRAFLVTGAAVTGGLVVGAGYLSSIDMTGLDGFANADGTVGLNAWIRIAEDGTITFAVPHIEMGQGIFTALPMLIAEELEIRLDGGNIRVEHPVDELPVYANYTLALDMRPEEATGPLYWAAKKVFGIFPLIVTGGSTSVVGSWWPLRVAGASARLMLAEAAADVWQVPAGECFGEDGHIVHRPTGRRLAYGELARAASAKAPTPNPPLKPASAFRLIGKPTPRLDVPAKVTGEAIFGIDVALPDMVHAAIRQSPVFGGTVRSMDAGAVRSMPGVIEVVDLGDAVGVVADSYWQASRAVAALPVEFDDNGNAGGDSARFLADMHRALDATEAHAFRDDGDVDEILAASDRVVEATYETPLLAHACMEPMNCTALFRDGEAELWMGSQSPLIARWGAQSGAKLAGTEAESVTTHVPLTGGGFGRRADGDLARQAAALAASVPGRPVKLIWSREEDIRHDTYRPHAVSRFRAALGLDGLPLAWDNRVVSQSLDRSYGDRNLPVGGGNPAKDHFSVEGAVDPAYAIPRARVELVDHATPVPIGFWRSVGHSNSAFFVESFVDECAHAAGIDPLLYRRGLLAGRPRHRKVLDMLAERSQWGRPLAPGRGRGVALHTAFRTIVGEVAEVTVGVDGALSVDRVVCVVDCGTVINPDTVEAQMEGAILFGLTAALHGEITIEEGRVAQSNFYDYRMLGLADAPAIETHIVPSGEPPGGIGEPGLPPALPALANAIFAATGQRLRALPISKSALRVA